MQLVRQIFSYSIIVVVVVMIASGYYYREMLFPNLFPLAGHHTGSSETTTAKAGTSEAGTSEVGTESMTEKHKATDMPAQDNTKMTRVDPHMRSAGAASVANAPVTLPSPVQPLAKSEIVTSSVPDAQEVAEKAASPERVAGTTGHSSASDSASRPGQTETHHMASDRGSQSIVPAHRQSTPVPTVTAAAPRQSGAAQLSPRLQTGESVRRDSDTIMMARQAYWTGDYAASEQAYQQLIDRHPDQVELYGEVGNVYYAQGKWVRAAAAYAQVVRQLYRTGQNAQADYMLQIVASLDSDLGEQLLRERDNTARQQ